MTARSQAIVVVGASLAGLRAAEELRCEGFKGTVTVVGDEVHAPYDRPPLSKQVLAGHWEADRLPLTVGVDGGIDALGLDWRLGTRAKGLDLDARQVVLDDGERLGFDGLVIATGATPRRLPGSEGLVGVHTLRTLDDCLAVRAEVDAGARRVVVVGAGFIGAEVAATCRTRGLDVTILEALRVPLGQALGEEMGAVLADVHRDHGVDVRLGTAVASLDGRDDGRVQRVRLADGAAIEADLVVVGIGVVPNTAWLEGSGLTLDDGVVCDATTLAAPGVVGAGDVARWPSRRFGELMRVEHWDNAITMGSHAARRLLAWLDAEEAGGHGSRKPEPYDPVPWFWSDQYDRKVQLAGRSSGADEVRVVDGSTEDRRFVALYRRGDHVVGALAMNLPRQLLAYQRLIERGATWTEALAFTGLDARS
ncbi:MAG TPA: FAD-dependent oxidoreductase [Acidimicrobiales bacterium]|jgi:3-phenylpropionate/trans-cinnamate dioxygenase ferredoxin reductase subunit